MWTVFTYTKLLLLVKINNTETVANFSSCNASIVQSEAGCLFQWSSCYSESFSQGRVT